MAHIEEMSGGRYRIVITEIPYQVNKTALIERIAELVRDGPARFGRRPARRIATGAGCASSSSSSAARPPRQVLNQLYKYTPLQCTFGVQMLALVEGEPRLLSLKRALQVYIEHRQVVITRRSQFELAKARQRGAHPGRAADRAGATWTR